MLRRFSFARTPGETFVEEMGTAVTLPEKEYLFAALVALTQRWEVRGDAITWPSRARQVYYNTYVYTLVFLFFRFFPAIS